MSTCMTRLTGLTSHAGALVAALVVLNGAAIACGGAAVADPNQDEQFLALLDDEGIPAVKGVPSLIYTAHEVCRKLDAGMSATGLVDKMVNDAYGVDPPERLYAPGRLARTEARFITAAVEVYCPYDQGKIASIEAISAAGWNVPTHRVIPYTHDAVNSAGELPKLPSTWDTSALSAPRQQPASTGIAFASLIGAVPSGEINEPTPPQLPTPSPPGAHLRTAPRPVATPPRPKHLPPPPQQPPPPAVGPQPGTLPAAAVSAVAAPAAAQAVEAAAAAAAAAIQSSRRQRHPCRQALSRSHHDYPAGLLTEKYKETATIGRPAQRTAVKGSLTWR